MRSQRILQNVAPFLITTDTNIGPIESLSRNVSTPISGKLKVRLVFIPVSISEAKQSETFQFEE